MAQQTKTAALTTAGGAVAIAANPSRAKGVITLENSDANRCYVLLGPGVVSSTNYSLSLAQNASVSITNMNDQIQAIWGTAAGGALMVTEWVN